MLTELAIILDRSGSMASVAKDVEGGFDRFITEQRATPNGECRVSLTQFDSLGVETLYNGKPLADVPMLKLEPRGNTPLLDAVGKTVTALKERIGRETAPADGRRVLVLIITDGQENASREYSKAQIKTLVEGQRAAGWDFMYLGANVDAFAEAGSMGIAAASSSPYAATPTGVAHSFTAMSSRVASYRAGGSADWTDEERAKIAQQQPWVPCNSRSTARAPCSGTASSGSSSAESQAPARARWNRGGRPTSPRNAPSQAARCL